MIVHKAHLSDAAGLDDRVDALEIGISVLTLPEVRSKPIDLGKRKSRPADFDTPTATLDMPTYAADAKPELKSTIRRNQDDLLGRLDALPEQEQVRPPSWPPARPWPLDRGRLPAPSGPLVGPALW